MNAIDFLRLVIQMRDAQKDFFIHHSQQALTRSKELERRVDAAALTLINQQPQQAAFVLSEEAKTY